MELATKIYFRRTPFISCLSLINFPQPGFLRGTRPAGMLLVAGCWLLVSGSGFRVLGSELSSGLCSLCSSLFALCSSLFALCSLLFDLRSLLFALCSLLFALCPSTFLNSLNIKSLFDIPSHSLSPLENKSGNNKKDKQPRDHPCPVICYL